LNSEESGPSQELDVHARVVIAGAGPVGLSMALGLARQGVRSIVLERETGLRPFSRALGVLSRTMEIFRAWGVLDTFLREGTLRTDLRFYTPGRVAPVAEVALGIMARHTAAPGVLIMSQSRTEAILLHAVEECGLAEVRFGHELAGFEQDPSGVTVHVTSADGEPYELPCGHLVGCDGAHSRVREVLGWHLEGSTYPSRVALADVRLRDERDLLPWPRLAAHGTAGSAAIRYEPECWRIISPVPPDQNDEEAIAEAAVAGQVERIFGAGPAETLWASVFRIHCRTSPHFRRGRVLLAGDAAHINSPAGGQGMNSGIQDAHNLAWKLARALRGGSEGLLASYEQERRGAVVSQVDRVTDFLTRNVLFAPPWRRTLFFRVALALLGIPPVLDRVTQTMGMLDTRYAGSVLLTGTGPLVGRRAPDGDLTAPDGSTLRLLDLAAADAALLLFDYGPSPAWNLEKLRAALSSVPALRVVRLLHPNAPPGDGYRDPTGCLWRAWRAAGDLAALVRPDGIVGWTARSPSSGDLIRAVRAALGTI